MHHVLYTIYSILYRLCIYVYILQAGKAGKCHMVMPFSLFAPNYKVQWQLLGSWNCLPRQECIGVSIPGPL